MATAIETKHSSLVVRVLGIQALLKVVQSVVLTVFISVVIAVSIEWIGITTEFWDEPGALHAKHSLLNELKWTYYISYWWDPLPTIYTLQKYK